MCDISTRLDTLNRQLTIISKLQNMEEDYNVCPRVTCKNLGVFNSFGKYCHCAHRILSLKEQCKRSNCNECILHDYDKKKIPCNTKTCKMRRKLNVYKSVQLTEVQTDSRDDLHVSRSANVSMRNETVSQELQEPERQSKSDQVNLTSQFYKMYTDDKIIDTYEEKNEQTIPTKDTSHAELGVNGASMHSVQQQATEQKDSSNAELGVNGASMHFVQQQATEQEKSHIEINKSTVDKMTEINQDVEDICAEDKKIIDQLQKELLSEKKRIEELEKELQSLTCSLNCLKEDSEQRAACLQGALETAKEQTEVAMNLVKQRNEQADFTTADRNELSNEIAKLQQQVTKITHKNTVLLKERDSLKKKLQSLSEDESKKCEEVEQEVNRMKQAVKEKEDALNKERAQFMDMIVELTNVINIQKRRICEVTGICNNQQLSIQEKDKELSEKNAKLSEVENILQSNNCVLQDMEKKIEELEFCLCEKTKACHCLTEELETFQENHLSEIRIKEKIVEEQNKTISKQRKLLHEGEEMVQQLASEFNQLRDELHEERQRSKSLQISLDETDDKLNKVYISQCEQCRALTAEIDYLKRENQRVTAIARLTYQKLHQAMKAYEEKIICEKQQHRYMALAIKKKDQQIEILKSQVYKNHMKTF
ncbi:hypothetical protein ANTQUA_LOCUS1976 [Anthophora quadrimaculata]